MAKDFSQFIGKKQSTQTQTPQQTGQRPMPINPIADPATFLKSVFRPGRVTGAVEGIKGSFQRAGEKLGRAQQGFQSGGANPLSNPKAAMSALGAAGEVVASPIVGALGIFQPELEETITSVASKIPESAKSKAKELIEQIPEEDRAFIGDTFAALGLLAAPAEIKAGIKAFKKSEQVVKGGIEKAGGIAESLKTPEISLTEKISPKLTAKEARKAISEGRVIKGDESKLFGKKPDIVEPAKDVIKAEETIRKRIPDYENLDEFSLKNKMKDEISTISEEIKPELQNTPLKPDTIQKAKIEWQKLKKSQQVDADFSTTPGFSGYQKNFETFLKELSKKLKDKTGKFRAKSLDDAWEVAKKYDQSIKNSVKEATSMSDSALQMKQDMWLQNRKILRDLITESSNDLGDLAKQSFSDMHDFYNAIENIIGKGVSTKEVAGPLSGENIKKWLLRATGAGVAGKILLD